MRALLTGWVLCLALGLAGCSGGTAPAEDAPAPAPAVQAEDTPDDVDAAPAQAQPAEPDAPAVDMEQAAVLTLNRCTECHNFTRAERYGGAQPWPDLVQRMIREEGALISQEEAAQIVAYLNHAYPL
jgi:mono/diheme cytochrome c family protein